MTAVAVRYIVEHVDSSIDFYTEFLDFEVRHHPAPGFAALQRGNLTLLLNAPGAGGAGRAAPDGHRPEPGGWNRFQIVVDDLDDTVERLADGGASFRTDVVTGKGGRQLLLEDPSGNVVELFEPSGDST